MSFMDPGTKWVAPPGLGTFQQQLQNLINQAQATPGSGGQGPFAQWAAQVGKWLNNPNKQIKNPFESGGGGLFTPWTAPVTAAHGMTVGQIRDAGQNPLVAGQYQPIQQAVMQNALSREGDQYGMNLRGAMQQALGTAMGEYNNAISSSNQLTENLLGQYGNTFRDYRMQQTPSLFGKIMQGIQAIGPAIAAPFTGGASLLAYAGMPGMMQSKGNIQSGGFDFSNPGAPFTLPTTGPPNYNP